MRKALLLLLLASLAATGCGREDEGLRPDPLLRDSLGLGDRDRVHRVGVSTVDSRETADPASVEIRPGDYVEFFTTDRRVHAVSFTLDSLSAEAAEFLRGSRQQGSPPLVEQGARFVVSFADAPLGRYPFLLVGNGLQTRGAVIVREPGR